MKDKSTEKSWYKTVSELEKHNEVGVKILKRVNKYLETKKDFEGTFACLTVMGSWDKHLSELIEKLSRELEKDKLAIKEETE